MAGAGFFFQCWSHLPWSHQDSVGRVKSFSTFLLTSATDFTPAWGQAHALCTRGHAQSSRPSETTLQRSTGWSTAGPRLSPWPLWREQEVPQAASRCPPSLPISHFDCGNVVSKTEKHMIRNWDFCYFDKWPRDIDGESVSIRGRP